MRGIIRMWDAAKSFGFIEAADGNRDVYFNPKSLADPQDVPWIRVGSSVEFALLNLSEGRTRAAQMIITGGK